MAYAILCPGQGAQHVGMGADLADTFEASRRVFEEASDALGLDLLAICREGPASELVRTDLQQPAILAVGAATYAALVESGKIDPAQLITAFGLSLGEFTALHVAGALALGDALRLVRERGLGMQEASEAVPSGLVALRAEEEIAEAVCAAAREATGGVCTVANLNAPGQIVISGDDPSLQAAAEAAKAHGIRRMTRLPVAGAFHSPLMTIGAERLAAALEGVTVHVPRVPVISNVTAEGTSDPEVIRANLVAQVTSPVRFVDCVRAGRALGVTTTIEVAPGKVLSGLARRIDSDLETFSVESAEALSALDAQGAK